MKLRQLALLFASMLAMSVVSCGTSQPDNGGKSNNNNNSNNNQKSESFDLSSFFSSLEDDSDEEEELTSTQKEAIAYFKDLTGKDAVAGTDYSTMLSKQCAVTVNFKTQYDSHEAITALAVSKLSKDVFDLERYENRGFSVFKKLNSTYSDAYSAEFDKPYDDAIDMSPGKVEVLSIHVATEADQDKLSSTVVTANGTERRGPDVGDWVLKVTFVSYQ